MNEIKKYNLTIAGESHSLLSDEPEEKILQTVVKVDVLIQEILEKDKGIGKYKAAILAALHLASQLVEKEANLTSEQQAVQQLVNTIDYEIALKST